MPCLAQTDGTVDGTLSPDKVSISHFLMFPALEDSHGDPAWGAIFMCRVSPVRCISVMFIEASVRNGVASSRVLCFLVRKTVYLLSRWWRAQNPFTDQKHLWLW